MHLQHIEHHDDSGKLGFISLTSDGKNTNFQYFEFNENHESIERIRKVNYIPPFGSHTSFLGSCNGLICVAREKTYIFNPITREYIVLPEIERVGIYYRVSGFGYVASTEVVRIVCVCENKTKFVEVYVYTLGSDHGWRNLGKFNFGIIERWGENNFVNGALYWLDYETEMIVPFNLAEEKFSQHLSLPLPHEDEYYDNFTLRILDGCLSFAVCGRVNGAECWDVLLLKKKDDNQSSGWSKVFSVYDSKFFAVTKSYSVLTHMDNHINILNPEASTLKTILDFKEHFDEVIPHKSTLVSLKELGEEDTKIMESVEN